MGVQTQVTDLAWALQAARHAVVLTGAGISTESGIPDFRSSTGLWQKVNPMQVASLTAFRRHPVEFFQFYSERFARLDHARPNPAHLALAQLEVAGLIKAVVTQNIDGLHQAAGCRTVIEVHGSIREGACVGCGRVYPGSVFKRTVATAADLPRCESCDALIKPGVVLFEEMLPEAAISRAFAEARRSDLLLVIGSSLEVGPINLMPEMALENGARLALINLDETHMDRHGHWVIHAKAGQTMTALVEALGLQAGPAAG